jgi:hypothetical protein
MPLKASLGFRMHSQHLFTLAVCKKVFLLGLCWGRIFAVSVCHCHLFEDGFCYTQVISDLTQLRGLLGLQLSKFLTFKCAPGSPGGAARETAARLARTTAVALARARAAASDVASAEAHISRLGNAAAVDAKKKAAQAEAAKAVRDIEEAFEIAENARSAAEKEVNIKSAGTATTNTGGKQQQTLDEIDVEKAARSVRNIEEMAGVWQQLLGSFGRLLDTVACWKRKQTTAAAEDAAEPHEQLRIVVFIDDLDRCKPSKIVEVLEAINIVLAGSNFSVVVGMVSLLLEVGVISMCKLSILQMAPTSFKVT